MDILKHQISTAKKGSTMTRHHLGFLVDSLVVVVRSVPNDNNDKKSNNASNEYKDDLVVQDNHAKSAGYISITPGDNRNQHPSAATTTTSGY
jgi:hypothetical protein